MMLRFCKPLLIGLPTFMVSQFIHAEPIDIVEYSEQFDCFDKRNSSLILKKLAHRNLLSITGSLVVSEFNLMALKR